MEHFTIGIDIGGTKTAYGVYDSERRLVTKRRRPSDNSMSPQEFFDVIAENVAELMTECNITSETLRGVGIGMPSYIRYEDGYILKTTNLTNIEDFAAKEYLQGRLGRDVRIILDNDGHTGALAEHRHGAGRGFDNMLYCPVSTGISSGIIIEGKLFRGRYGWAGESGHMIVTPDDGVMCGCGNSGCLMSWCSGSMIVKHVQKWIANGETTIMTEMAEGAENITAVHIDKAWQTGDEMAIRALEQMAKYMAIWIYNLYVTLNINCYVFGGGLLRMGDKLFGRVREIFDMYNQDDKHPVYFRNAELSEDFGIVGATELLFQ